MGSALTKEDERHTYAEYRHWPAEERWELIDGTAWSMYAAPSRAHQDLSAELLFQLKKWLKGKPLKKDLNDKFHLYERVGVREYWVVDPSGSLQSYSLADSGRFGNPVILEGSGKLESTVLQGFTLDVAALFAELEA